MVTRPEMTCNMMTEYMIEKVVPVIAREMPNHVGRLAALSEREIIRDLNRWTKEKVDGFALREMMRYCTNAGLVKGLITVGGVYYVATNEAEFRSYIERVESRIKKDCFYLHSLKSELKPSRVEVQTKIDFEDE